MTVTECIRKIESLGGKFIVIAPDLVTIQQMPDNPPPGLIACLHANREAIKADILQRPDRIIVEPLIERLHFDEDQDSAILAIRELIDNGLITLVGKVKFFLNSGIVDVPYIINDFGG